MALCSFTRVEINKPGLGGGGGAVAVCCLTPPNRGDEKLRSSEPGMLQQFSLPIL
jgi:hypothetical protein